MTRESGLDYFHARYYNPRLGRFMSPDPANVGAVADNPQSWNGYSYALNNPGTLTDPLGACVTATLIGAVGGSQSQGGMYEGSCSAPPLENVSEEVATELLAWKIRLRSVLSQGPIPPTVYHSGHLTQMPTQPQTQSPPWYKNSCVTGALGKGALSVGIDSIGLIPEAGGIARVIGHQAGYVGVVADQLGRNVIDAVDHTARAGQGLSGLGDTSTEGLTSTGLTIAGFIPGLNDAAAVGSIGLDLFRTAKAIGACY